MRVGVGSTGAVVSCLGGDGGRTPPVPIESGSLDIPVCDTSKTFNILRAPIE